MLALTEAQLQTDYRGWYRRGQGRYAILCSSARRISFFATEDLAHAYSEHNCGFSCDRYAGGGHTLAVLESPAPKFGYTKKIREWV